MNAGLLCVLAACSSTAARNEPLEYLDPQTAATLTTPDQPLVFARDRPEFAANVRDYLTLVAMSVNRAGKVDYYLVAYFWSTVDARGTTSAVLRESVPVIAADDRRIELKARQGSPRDVGIGLQLHRPPGVVTEPLVYATDLATLRFVTEARQLSVQLDANVLEASYGIWKDQRPALAAFVAKMSPR
jgi:hypothetical protein